MTLLGHLAAFTLGVYLSIRMIAALYQVLDLRYRIGTHSLRVISGVVVWTVTIAATAFFLDPTRRAAFAWGLGAFLLFYVSLFGLRHLLIAALREPPDRAGAGARGE